MIFWVGIGLHFYPDHIEIISIYMQVKMKAKNEFNN